MLRFRQCRKPEQSVTGKIIDVTYSYSVKHSHHTIIAVEAQGGQVYIGIKPGYDTSLVEGSRVEMGLRGRKFLEYPRISSLSPVEPVNADESPTPYILTDRQMAISRLRGLVGQPVEVRYVAGINGSETAHNEIATLMGSGILSAGEGDNLYIGYNEGFHAIPVSGIRSIKSGTTRIYENPQIDSKTGNNIFSAASEGGVDVVIGGLEIAGGIKTNRSSVRKQPIWGVPSQSV